MEFKLHYGDSSEGSDVIQRNDVKQKLLSLAFPSSPACRFPASALLWCGWAWEGMGREGRIYRALLSALPAAGETGWFWELVIVRKGREGLGGKRLERNVFLALFSLEVS